MRALQASLGHWTIQHTVRYTDGRTRSVTIYERRDENRNVGLGAEHDWSSHAADAFGYTAISYEEPPVISTAIMRPAPPRMGSWAA
jgi:phage terminase large subunit